MECVSSREMTTLIMKKSFTSHTTMNTMMEVMEFSEANNHPLSYLILYWKLSEFSHRMEMESKN